MLNLDDYAGVFGFRDVGQKNPPLVGEVASLRAGGGCRPKNGDLRSGSWHGQETSHNMKKYRGPIEQM